MTRLGMPFVCGTALLALTLLGCHKPNMEDMMKPSPRPAELDRLAMWVGTWEGQGEMKMAGSDEVVTGQGVSTMDWDAAQWVLVEHGTYTMKDETHTGIGVWTWDAPAKKYRMYWFDSHGGTGLGTATYDAATNTWHMKYKGQYGKMTTVGEGTTRFVNDNTMEWTCTEWNAWKTRKLMEMKGTSRRK